MPPRFMVPLSHTLLHWLKGSLTCFIPAFLSSGLGLFSVSKPVMKTPVVM